MLGNDDNANCVVEAAAYLAHPDLLPLLTAFDDPDDGYLAIALTECDPQRRGQRDEFGWAVVEQIRALHPELHVALGCRRYEIGTQMFLARTPIDDDSPLYDLNWLVEQYGDDVDGAVNHVLTTLSA